MGKPLRPYLPLPPPRAYFFVNIFLELQKKLFFLSGPAFTPSPLLVIGPLLDELFFAASLSFRLTMWLKNIGAELVLFMFSQYSPLCSPQK